MIGGRDALVAAIVLLVVSVSGWVGYGLSDGRCNAGKLEVARAYAEATNGAVEAGRRASEDAEARIAQLRRKQAASLSRAEALNHALANLPRRPDGDFTADELRALGSLHAELFTSAPSQGSMSSVVPGSPATQ